MNYLVDVGLKATVILGIAFAIAFYWRRSSAAVRYAMWICTLAGVLMLPLASWLGPVWDIERDVPVNAQPAPVSTSVVVHADRAPADQHRPWVAIVWMAGAIVMVTRTAAGHWRVRSLFGAAVEIGDRGWLALAEEVATRVGFRRKVILKRSVATDVPLSYGLFRATVLLPGDSGQWSEERRRVVLAHELIHARRLDSFWGLVAQTALAVNWFHPLAWLAVRQFRKEQECSCDDAVVAAGTPGAEYAAHLVDLARSIAIPEPALGMAERFDLEGRVHALLDRSRSRRGVSRRLGAAMFAGSLALVIPLAAVHAQAAKGSVAGTVYDPSGAVVPGASITLNGGVNEEFTRANQAGQFKLVNVSAGEYVIKVTSPGFATYSRKLIVDAGSPATMSVNLALGELTESVEIRAAGPQARSNPAGTPQRIRVGGMVQPVKLISRVTPAYPPDAKAEGVEGTVLLRAIVSKDGRLLGTKVVSSAVDPRLASAAMDAVQLWQYQPALLNGEPVEVVTTIAIAFRLD